MTTNYVINLVNQSATTQVFWCFLAKPKELASDSKVFANSSTCLAVPPNSTNVNTFTIPVQYVVGAGASNNAVGLNIKVTSTNTQNSDLGDGWLATYADWPPPMGPTMVQQGSAPSTAIAIATNSFNQVQNEQNGWFSNQSFGIRTAQGFIGMSWAPTPLTTRTLTPKLTFYVSTGTFDSNELADFTTVSTASAEISVPGDFQYGQTTVTLGPDGKWTVTKGAPPEALLRTSQSVVARLVDSHAAFAQAHAQLVAASAGASSAPAQAPASEPHLALGGSDQSDTIASVTWNAQSEDSVGVGNPTLLTGTLTVGTALAASFGFFVLAGTTFSVTSSTAGGTRVNFKYSGPQSASWVKSLFVAGASLLFTNTPKT